MTSDNPTRRHAIGHGLAALAALHSVNMFGRSALAAPLPIQPDGDGNDDGDNDGDNSGSGHSTDPILRLRTLGPSESIGDLRFAPQWFGDIADSANEGSGNWGSFPAPEESTDILIIGGGMSGIGTAYALRSHRPILLELRSRLGGNAVGESIGEGSHAQSWSLGNTCFMRTNPDSPLGRLYSELGVDQRWRVDNSETTFEYEGAIETELLGQNPSAADIAALAAYRAAVTDFAQVNPLELPFYGAPSLDVQELDSRTFAEDLALRCGTLPPRLAYLLQAFCCSKFGIGMDEINAAAAWKFLAAEESGQSVMLGGNAGFARALMQHARQGGARFRTEAQVKEVIPTNGGYIVHWRDSTGGSQGTGRLRSTFARQLVMATPKGIARSMMPWLAAQDQAKFDAMGQVRTAAHVVATILLSRPVGRDFNGIYLQGSSDFPMNANELALRRPIMQAYNAGFAFGGVSSRVITLRWPLAWPTAESSIAGNGDWRTYAGLAAPQIREFLAELGIGTGSVRQIRLARWMHGTAYARPGVYTGGVPQALDRAVFNNIWFPNQDTWCLPSIEGCLTEALRVAERVEAALS